MTHRSLAVLAAVALACTPVNAAPIEGPRSSPTVAVVAAGDTAIITASWSAGRNATGYLVTSISGVTTGAWSYLPAAVGTALGHPTTARSLVIKAANATADSGDFQICVRGTRGTRQAATATCAPAVRWIRLPSSPDTVRVDSIGVGMLEFKTVDGTFRVSLGGQKQICPFIHLAPSGHVAMRAVDTPIAACVALYATAYTASQRAVTVDEQRWLDCVLPYVCPAGFRRIEGFDPTPLRSADGS